MKEFIQDNWFKLSLLAVIIVFGIFFAYWTQIKPAAARKQCVQIAEDEAVEYYNEQNYGSNEQGQYSINNYRINFEQCLSSRGVAN